MIWSVVGEVAGHLGQGDPDDDPGRSRDDPNWQSLCRVWDVVFG